MAAHSGVVEVKGWLKVWRSKPEQGEVWEKMMCHAGPEDGFQGWLAQAVDKGPPALHLALQAGSVVSCGPSPGVEVPSTKQERTFWVQTPQGDTLICLQAPNAAAAQQWRQVLAALMPPAPLPSVDIGDRRSVTTWAKAVASRHASELPPGVASAIAQEWARRKAVVASG